MWYVNFFCLHRFGLIELIKVASNTLRWYSLRADAKIEKFSSEYDFPQSSGFSARWAPMAESRYFGMVPKTPSVLFAGAWRSIYAEAFLGVGLDFVAVVGVSSSFFRDRGTCSSILSLSRRSVRPTYTLSQWAHLNWYTTLLLVREGRTSLVRWTLEQILIFYCL